MQIVFVCRDRSSDHLACQTPRTKLNPELCLGMCADWARTLLAFGKTDLAMMHPARWGTLQAAYELDAAPGLDAALTLQAQGLEVVNGTGKEVVFQGQFSNLVPRLTRRVGTFIASLAGEPGQGEHFLAFRRLGLSRLLAADFFDPNDAYLSFNDEREYDETFLAGLNRDYGGRQPGTPRLTRRCVVYEVRLAIPAETGDLTLARRRITFARP